jgi:hypothetical protein
MPKYFDDDKYEDAFDERGLLKDGKAYRVPLYMRDSATKPLIGDARFQPMADAAQALADAYRAYDEADANAWRNPPNGPCLQCDASGEFGRDIPVGAYPPSAGEGSRCTINGQDGRLVRKGNWLVCEPTRANDAQSLQDARAEAYRLYDEEMANAWRNPR